MVPAFSSHLTNQHLGFPSFDPAVRSSGHIRSVIYKTAGILSVRNRKSTPNTSETCISAGIELWITVYDGLPLGRAPTRGVHVLFCTTVDVIHERHSCTVDRNFSIRSLQSRGHTSEQNNSCLLYTSPSPRDRTRSRMPSSA